MDEFTVEFKGIAGTSAQEVKPEFSVHANQDGKTFTLSLKGISGKNL